MLALALQTATHGRSALSEIMGVTLPYDSVLALRDRMWDIAPHLVKYDATERVSEHVTAAGLATLVGLRTGKASGQPFKNPIVNFYQTDPISRACVQFSLRG